MKVWQAQLGLWGSLLWIMSFQLIEIAEEHNYEKIAHVAFGYTMGFIMIFAGQLLWDQHSRDGILSELFENNPLARYLFEFCLLLVALVALVQLFLTIFRDLPWYYNLSAMIGGLVVNQGVKPIIEHLEGR